MAKCSRESQQEINKRREKERCMEEEKERKRRERGEADETTLPFLNCRWPHIKENAFTFRR